MRRVALVLTIPIVLLLALPARARDEAQTGAESGAQTAMQAEPAAGASSLDAEVAQLKRLVAENERRIAALEARLAEMSGEPATEPPSDPAEGDGAATPGPAEQPAGTASSEPDTPHARSAEGSAADLPPWAREESWRKIRIGMAEDEVLELLGPPDSTREIGFTRRLIYKGQVPGRGFLKGVVKLSDGAVSDLDLPDF